MDTGEDAKLGLLPKAGIQKPLASPTWIESSQTLGDSEDRGAWRVASQWGRKERDYRSGLK